MPMGMSLTKRLVVSTSVVLGLFLLMAGVALDQAFSISLDNIVREKLRLHTYNMLSLADNENGFIQLPKHLAEKRFNSVDESLLGFVSDLEKKEFWRSVSAAGKLFNLPHPGEGEWLFGQAEDESGQSYYASSFSTIWPDLNGKKSIFVFTVMENREYYAGDLSEYRFFVGLALTVLGLILILMQLIILRWGLMPLRGLVTDVIEMNKGQRQSLEGDYSKELYPLTSNVNLLIENERRQRERYRERMADLSHSLKTPLSVLRGIEADIDGSGQPISRQAIVDTLKRQVGRMSDIIDYQLQRAVASDQKISFLAIPLASEVELIVRALDKVYAENKITAYTDICEKISVYADENDVVEVLGNLLDNAYKYASGKVKIAASKFVGVDGEATIEICIEDDGVGIPLSQQADILQRGFRLDTSREGQGFGLAIAVEIIKTYKGKISVADSAFGGAKFTFEFPAK
jgi:two-component system sensor histidine kinase PhoQ